MERSKNPLRDGGPDSRHHAPQTTGGMVGDNYRGPIFNSVVGGHGNTVNLSRATIFDLLKPNVAHGALYDSRERQKEHASTCHPDTCNRIIQRIEKWFISNAHPVCWLHGPAGTGKSTIAHTIAERFQESERLAATFFFSRKKGDREDIDKLIPTLAYQIAERIPATQALMQRVLQENQTLLTRTIQRQFQKLIIEPLTDIGRLERSLVVLDGLDECASKDGLLVLIRLLGETATTAQLPFRFLLTSRRERDIEVAFQSHVTGSTTLWLALEDSKEDVQRYLREHLQNIRRNFDSVMQSEPTIWPSDSDLRGLVTKSQGLFIYASTAVQYIGDGNGPPQKKLQKVLEMHDGVDPLYTQVINDARQSEGFDRVMGSLMYLRYPLTIDELSEFMRLDISDIRAALDRCHSILVIPDSNSESIQPYHASLRDFLTSQERSQNLFCAPAEYHAMLMSQSLKAITNAIRNNDAPTKYTCIAWYYHGSLLLSEANASREFQSLLCEVLVEMKAIDLKWLKCWMREAGYWVGIDYFTVDLPSSMSLPREHQELQIKLRRIKVICNDFRQSHFHHGVSGCSVCLYNVELVLL